MECVLVGMPGSGRSTLLAALLRSWACRHVPASFWLPQGSPSRARIRLPSEERRILSLRPSGGFLAVELPAAQLGLGGRRWTFLETPGLSDDTNPGIGQAMADTLARILGADVVLHLIDAAVAAAGRRVSAVDLSLNRVGQSLPGYVPLATKTDAPGGESGVVLLRQFMGERLIPCSAVVGQGIRQIRAFLASIVV